jgi:hypothetical protein
MMAGTDVPVGKSARERPRSLLVHEWPDADQRAGKTLAGLVLGSNREAPQAIWPR